MNPTVSQKKVLIVDDVRENIDILRGVLKDYTKMFALEGAQALALATSDSPPDLVLLDIMMPNMDGYEVCRRLKSDARTKDIPIIFLTAKTSIEDEAKGLALGAVDYITKPISPPVVLARVITHLAMRDAYVQLEQHYTKLKEMDRLRKDMEAISRHDLKSPIDGIVGCIDLLLHGGTFSQEDLNKFHGLIRTSALQLREMVNLSLNLIKMERGEYEAALRPTNIVPIIHRIMTDNQTRIDRRSLKTPFLVHGQPEQPEQAFSIMGDETLFYTMMANLYKNAMEASGKDQTVTVSLNHENEMAHINIHNQSAIPKEIRERFFEKYVTSGKGDGTGLGTYSARLMAETQGGKILMKTSEEEGTTLTIVLRAATGGGGEAP